MEHTAAQSQRRRSHRPSVSVLAENHELYALRLLLLHVPGITSFWHFNPDPNDNTQPPQLRKAAEELGLLHNVDEVDQISEEMIAFECGLAKQCDLFALILVWHDVSDARELWARNWRQIAATDLRKLKNP